MNYRHQAADDVVSAGSIGSPGAKPRRGQSQEKPTCRSSHSLLLISIGLLTMLAAPVAAQSPITEQEAHAIGAQAYLYFYSLVTMDLTRKQLTNVERPEGIHTPMNTFSNLREYTSADMRVVVRPNFD